MRRSDLGWLWSNRPLLISQIIGLPLVVAWLLYVYFHGHVAFALVLVCLIPAFAAINVLTVNRSRRRLSDPSARKDQVTGESVLPILSPVQAGTVGRWTGAADIPGTMGRMNASTPLAVLEVSDGSLTLRVRPNFLATLFGAKALALAPAQVEAVFPARGRLRYKAIGIRPLKQPPSYFLTVGADRSPILSTIAAAGFPVEWEERGFSYG